MQAHSKSRVFGLDLMRAIAIVLVVFSHVSWIVPNAQGIIPDMMGIAGVLGVEIFFVLSGFLIGRIIYKLYLSDDFSFKSISYFWVRRWFRTLPTYYLALILNIGIAIYLGYSLPDNLWTYVVFLQNFATEMPSFFVESWSLSIEEFAYIIGPLLLYGTLFIKTKWSKSKQFLIITLLIIMMFTITKWFYSINDDIKSMRYWNSHLKAVVIYRIDAIYYGVFGAYISMVKPKFWKHSKYIGVILGALLLFVLNLIVPLQYIFIETHPFFWNLWYLPLNSVAVLLVLPILSELKKAPKLISRPITFISVISYAIYVFHYSIILQLMKNKWASANLPKMDILIYIITYLCLIIVISYLVYRFFEKPMTNLRDSSKIRHYFK
ncbi:acyltransferase family protein [Winogradskyella eximia]|uniref:acyltransferase family protein n=1 Tax=Winogradskyella eximia TaxID=262006 RepID=UPI00248FB595|nr:acyltransferase [Winogradskyella eximia]